VNTTMRVLSRPRIAYDRARPEHRGWNGILHRGVTFALMDETLGWARFITRTNQR
jgi:hypothetical protein